MKEQISSIVVHILQDNWVEYSASRQRDSVG